MKSLTPARLALIGGLTFSLAVACLVLPRGLERISPIWLPNALLLALLRTSAPAMWPRLMVLGFGANALANLAAGDHAALALALALCNLVEFGGAAWLLRRLIGPQADIARPSHIAHYLATCAIAALVSAALAWALLARLGETPTLASAATWAMADFAGLIIVTPCLVILMGARRPFKRLQERPAWPFALLLAATALTFLQAQHEFLYLIVAALVLVTWRLGLLGAAVGILFTLGAAVAATVAGLGPFATGGGPVAQQMLLLQLFLAVCFSLSVPIGFQRRRARKLAEALEGALTEAREADARHRLIAERAQDLIVRADCSGKLLYVSPSCRSYGYEPGELVGRHADDLLHPDDIAHHERNMRLLFQGRTPPASARQHRFRSKDGTYGWLEGNPALITGSDGGPVEILNVFRNITEHKLLEEALGAAREEAEAAARAKSDFLANMSHELRTPLTSVVGYTKLALEQSGLTGLPRTYVERVSHASEALLSTVNDILDFSKLEAGEISFQPQPTPLAPLLRATLALFEPQAAAKDVALRLDTDVSEALSLLVDPDRLRQVMLNLVGNAVKFTASGQVTLRARYDEAAGSLAIAVEDTGPGIPEEAQQRLFRRFSQVDGSLARTHGGTGLGLAICKGIVEALGGRIGVRSRLGQGSTFYFEAPLQIAASARSAASDVTVSLDPGLRVLVVDDHAVNRELASLMLAGAGAEITEAGDGETAVELAAASAYDLILMDLRMPKLDGQGALDAIRAAVGPNRRTPILAFTADASPELEARLRDSGFQGVLGKPVVAEVLFRTIGEAVALGGMAGELREAS